MRGAVHDILPTSVRRSLKKLGEDIEIARKKRRLTMAMMSERVGVSMATYQRAQTGDPTVGIGVYAMILFVLGMRVNFGEVLDAKNDDQGLLLEAERLPRKVRPARQRGPS